MCSIKPFQNADRHYAATGVLREKKVEIVPIELQCIKHFLKWYHRFFK